jgi:hypothetical protein
MNVMTRDGGIERDFQTDEVLGVPPFHTADGTKPTRYDLPVTCTGDCSSQIMQRASPSLSKTTLYHWRELSFGRHDLLISALS